MKKPFLELKILDTPWHSDPLILFKYDTDTKQWVEIITHDSNNGLYGSGSPAVAHAQHPAAWTAKTLEQLKADLKIDEVEYKYVRYTYDDFMEKYFDILL